MMCHFLIPFSSLIVCFLKRAIHCPHKPQHLWMMVLHQVMISMTPIVLQANSNGSITVHHSLTFIIPLSPLPEQEEILLHHLYDIWMFSHCIQYNTTATAANAIPTMLDSNLHQLLQSLFKTERLLNMLSDLKANMIHMCKNSCCAFNGPFAKGNHCPLCKHTWRDQKGLPYKIFWPIPLIPWLQAMYANPNMARVMCYHELLIQKPYKIISLSPHVHDPCYVSLCVVHRVFRWLGTVAMKPVHGHPLWLTFPPCI